MITETLCENLALSIYKEAMPHETGREQVRVCLRDDMSLTEFYECYPINEGGLEGRKYHVREAVILSIRRLVGEAFARGMINEGSFSNCPGVSINLSIPQDEGELPITSTTG